MILKQLLLKERGKMKKILSLLLTVVSLPLFAAPAAPAGAAVGISTVSEQNDKDFRTYTAQVISQHVVNIVPRVSGEIIEVGFHDGSVVKTGQMLYKIDPVQYEAAVKAAEANVEKIRAELLYLQSSFERISTLYKKNAQSKESLENARSKLAVAKASLKAAEADLLVAQDNLKHTVLKSPISGLAGISSQHRGNYITPSSGVLVSIVQFSPIRVRFSMSMADIMSMFKNQTELQNNADITVQLANGTVYPEVGRVAFVDNAVNQRTDTIPLYAGFKNSDRKLVNGSVVTVTISHKKGVTRAAVSPSAVLHDANGAFVYLVKNGLADKVYVTTGNSTPEKQLILAGVKVGDQVISKGTHKVYPGCKINIVERD